MEEQKTEADGSGLPADEPAGGKKAGERLRRVLPFLPRCLAAWALLIGVYRFCLCVCTHASMYAFIWRPDVNIGSHSSAFSHCLFEMRLLIGLEEA